VPVAHQQAEAVLVEQTLVVAEAVAVRVQALALVVMVALV
jgi:hypothetical protein